MVASRDTNRLTRLPSAGRQWRLDRGCRGTLPTAGSSARMLTLSQLLVCVLDMVKGIDQLHVLARNVTPMITLTPEKCSVYRQLCPELAEMPKSWRIQLMRC